MYTLKEISEKCLTSECKSIYSEKILKQKEHVYFTEFSGRADAVCFRDMASYVIYELKKSEETKEDIIKAAATIIKFELREMNKTTDEYSL